MGEIRASGPLLSVGLAVYNGEEFLEAAIDSILSQTFTDFELIISDNASTDSTAEICRRYLDDPRVRYHRNATNIGGANNENQTFELSTGEYFRLAAHDDVCAPTLFEKCMAVLQADDDVVLCYTRVVNIDGKGEVQGTHMEGRGTSHRPSDRFRSLAARNHQCEPTYGIIRSSVLRSTPLQRNYTDSDRILLCELGLKGRFVQLDEGLFFKRSHDKNVYYDWRERMSWFKPDRKPGRIEFPNWIELYWLWHTALTVPDDLGTKFRCAAWSVEWTARRSLSLARDVYEAARALVGRRRRDDEWRHNWV